MAAVVAVPAAGAVARTGLPAPTQGMARAGPAATTRPARAVVRPGLAMVRTAVVVVAARSPRRRRVTAVQARTGMPRTGLVVAAVERRHQPG